MVERYPNLKEKLTVRFPAVRFPLYLTEYLLGGQLPSVLWRWLVGLLSQEKKGRGSPREVKNPLGRLLTSKGMRKAKNEARIYQMDC